MFEGTSVAGWGDMDFNAHMRNTAYLDKAADVRMMYFAQWGFPMSEFARIRVGPVVMCDQIEYFREIHLLEEMRISLRVAGLSGDGGRMKLRNDFYRGERLAARVTSTAGWLDLTARKLVLPPLALFDALQSLEHSADFEVLPESGG